VTFRTLEGMGFMRPCPASIKEWPMIVVGVALTEKASLRLCLWGQMGHGELSNA
jgi:hypothetical protein